jgi:hypothetical protein
MLSDLAPLVGCGASVRVASTPEVSALRSKAQAVSHRSSGVRVLRFVAVPLPLAAFNLRRFVSIPG